MRKKNKFWKAVSSYLAFFCVIALTVTAAVIIYEMIRTSFDGDKNAIAWLMLIVCLGLSLFCSTFDTLRRKFTSDRAVEDILEATDKITAGNFAVKLTPRHPYGKYDDLDCVMENLNNMAEELSKNEMLKNDFISNVSHEIKTPLAIIQSYATLLAKEDLTAEERGKYCQILSQTAMKTAELVSNVLKLNKLENQRFLPEMTKVNLQELLAQTVFSFEDAIESKNIDLQCEAEEVCAITSAPHLEIVLNNLLSNAIKFVDYGGKVKCTVKAENGNAVFVICDDGCGMNEETGRRIFDKFYQGDTSHAKEGNGLGLALVKKVVDVLGGEISVESKPGEGSKFTVIIKGAANER